MSLRILRSSAASGSSRRRTSGSLLEFAATAEYHAWLKQGRQLPAFMYSKKERAKLGIEA